MMGIDTTTFQIILDVGFEYLWDSTPIPQTDTNAFGEPSEKTTNTYFTSYITLFTLFSLI